MKKVTCPKCEALNPLDTINCSSCQVNFALHYPEFFKRNQSSYALSQENPGVVMSPTNQLQSREIPVNAKTLIHILSILLLPIIFTVVMLSDETDMGVWIVASLMTISMLAGFMAFFYYLVDGFQSYSLKVAGSKGILFLILSGLVYGLAFLGFWFLIRFIVVKSNKLSWSDVKGKPLNEPKNDDFNNRNY